MASLGVLSVVNIEPSSRVPGINAVPHEENLRYFDVSIHGPVQSPYEGRINLILCCGSVA